MDISSTTKGLIVLLLVVLAAIMVRLAISGLVAADSLVGFLVLSIVVLAVFLLNERRTRLVPMDLMRTVMRLEQGEAAQVQAEAEKKRLAGDRSAENALLLSGAHCYQGRGKEAETFAYEALATLERSGAHRETDQKSRILYDMAAISLFDSLVAQGEFAKAARGLQPRIETSHQPNLLRALVIWGWFLAGEEGEARAVLSQLDGPAGRAAAERAGAIQSVTSKYQFILGHIRRELFGTAFDLDFRAFQHERARWGDEAARNAANPYGQRLSAILAAIDAAA